MAEAAVSVGLILFSSHRLWLCGFESRPGHHLFIMDSHLSCIFPSCSNGFAWVPAAADGDVARGGGGAELVVVDALDQHFHSQFPTGYGIFGDPAG